MNKTATSLASASVLLLTACGMYGVSYPKPDYDYIGQADDPVLVLESPFGAATQFKAQLHADATDEETLCEDTRRLAFMQAKDSYFRDPKAQGPWTFEAPAGKPLLVAGQWMNYGSSYYDGLSKSMISTGTRTCPWAARVFTPQAGERYRLRLAAEAGRCTLTITTLQGAAVPSQATDACGR